MLRSWKRAVPLVQDESGHPSGRRPGSRNTTTLLCEAFLETQGEGLARTLVNLANGGDPTALRLCIDRIMPRGAGRPILFPLPRVDSAATARQAVADVIEGMARAELVPREGSELLKVIERGAKIIATAEAAEAVAREGQPRHIQVSWVETKDIEIAWKACWKEQYEALYGPLPELPDPEEDGWLPPEKAPAAAAPGVPADRQSAPAAPAGTPLAPPAVARDGTGNNENNGSNENTMAPATGDPPLPPSLGREAGNNETTKTMETTKIQGRRGRHRGPAPVTRRAPSGR